MASRRGKNNRAARESADNIYASRPLPPQPSKPTNDTGLNAVPRGAWNDSRAEHEAMPTPTVRADAGGVPVCVTFDEDHQVDDQQPVSDHRPKDCSTHTPLAAHGARGRHTPEVPEGWPLGQRGLVSRPLSGPNTLDHHGSAAEKALLPTFITPLPTHMPSEDLGFLAQKGAFAIPKPELRAEILRSYIFSVHPFMPIVDVSAAAHAILDEREDSRISLLLFQAVMFAGLASLDQQFVHCLGFESAKQAREAFFNRVKLLYEFDVEPDQVAVLQSLLLMSWWYGRWDQRRHTWHWTGLALSVALNLGLHREPSPRCGSNATRGFRRRLWWSLYIRDRLLALGTRRPMRIRDDDFDVAMLTLEDFDIQSLCEFGHGQPPTTDVEEHTCMALICIELAKLSICIGHVLSLRYTTLRTERDVPYTMMVVPKCDGDRTANELEECDREINEWFQASGPNIRREGPRTAPDGMHSCAEVHWAMLNMLHLTLVNVLHRTQALQPLSDTAEAEVMQKASRSKVKAAACNVTKLACTILRRDQARFLGPPGITALVAACLSHMLDIRSGEEDVRDAGIFRFYQTMQVLQSLRGIYASADSAVAFLVSTIRRASIPLPAQAVTPAPDFMSAVPERHVGLTTTSKGNNGWKDATATCQDRTTAIAHEQPNAASANWQVNQSLLQPTKSYPQSITLPDLGPEGPRASSIMMHPTLQPVATHSPSAMPFVAPSCAPTSGPDNGTSSTREHNISQHFVATSSAKITDPADANAPFSEWNSSLDSGFDFEPDEFNYDFYSDAFGLFT